MKKSSGKRITQKEIAKLIGVSPATISNAFHNPHQLSPELRHKILSECQKYGYNSPKSSPEKALVKQSHTICIILSDSLSYSFSDPVASLFLKGVSEVLTENNLQLLLIPGDNADNQQTSLLAMADGIIVYGAPRDPRIFDRATKFNKPLITVDFDHEGYGSINIDNLEGAYSLAKQVMGKAKHVAILGLRLVDTDRVCRITHEELLDDDESISRRRLRGYLRAAEEQKVVIPPEYIWTIPENLPEHAEMATREALAHNPRPELLLCMSDVFALAALRTTTLAGLKVPEDIRIAGFDGITQAEHNLPPVTTVHQQVFQKGKMAVQLLIDGQIDQHTVIPTSVFTGQTA